MSGRSGLSVIAVVAAWLLLPATAAGDQAAPVPNNLGAAIISAAGTAAFNNGSTGISRPVAATAAVVLLVLAGAALAESAPDGIVFVPQTPQTPTPPAH